MAIGLIIRDPAGNIKVDLNSRLLRFIGMIIVGPGPASGSVTDDGFLTGTPFCFVSMHSNNGIAYWPGEGLLAGAISFSGNQMFWSLNTGQPTQRLQYGVH